MSDENLAVWRFDQGEYYKSFSGLKRLADEASVEGELRLGYIYQYGLASPTGNEFATIRNEAAAMQQFQRAANQGDARGFTCMAVLYVQGIDTPHDYAKAVQFLHEAVQKGAPFAKHDLGVMYQNGLGVTKDEQRANELYDDMDPVTRSVSEAYQIRLRSLIYQNRSFLAKPASKNHEGKAGIGFKVYGGAAYEVKVIRSSGYADLDAAAVQVVKSTYFPPPPLGMMLPNDFQVVLNVY